MTELQNPPTHPVWWSVVESATGDEHMVLARLATDAHAASRFSHLHFSAVECTQVYEVPETADTIVDNQPPEEPVDAERIAELEADLGRLDDACRILEEEKAHLRRQVETLTLQLDAIQAIVNISRDMYA